MIYLAEGEQSATETFSRKAASTLDSIGVLIFLTIALTGIVVAGTFFANYWATPESARLTLLSGGIIPPSNVGIGLKVCASLYLIVLVLAALQRENLTSDTKENSP